MIGAVAAGMAAFGGYFAAAATAPSRQVLRLPQALVRYQYLATTGPPQSNL